MAHSTDPCPSLGVHTASPGAVKGEVFRPVIDLNLPPLDDLMDDQDTNSSVSDCKSVVSANQSGDPPLLFIGSGLMELSKGNKLHHLIKEHFFSRLTGLGMQVTSFAIHQNCRSDVSAKARAKVFEDCAQAVQNQGRNNTAIVNWAWYTTSKEEATKILSYGFDYGGKPEKDGVHDRGDYFAPYDHLLESVISAPIDEDGLGHLLLCRVILGKSKLVISGSANYHSPSEKYDSGVDDLFFPRRYIIWSTPMNTRVLPMYIVSFRASCCLSGLFTASEKPPQSIAPSLPYLILMYEFMKISPPSPSHVSLISKNEGKNLRQEMLQQMMQIAWERMPYVPTKTLRTKERKIPGQKPTFKQMNRNMLLDKITRSLKTEEGKIKRRELMQNIRRIAGDTLFMEIMKILKNK